MELQSAIIGGAEGNTYRGHDGVRQWMAESDAAFEDLRVEPQEFRDAGHRVLMLGHVYARGRASGVDVDSPIAWLCTLRGSRIVSQRGYLNPEEALESLALPEQGTPHADPPDAGSPESAVRVRRRARG